MGQRAKVGTCWMRRGEVRRRQRTRSDRARQLVKRDERQRRLGTRSSVSSTRALQTTPRAPMVART